MDREVIEHKLEFLRPCLQRVVEKCPSDPDKLGRGPDLQDIGTLNLNGQCNGVWTSPHTLLSTLMCSHRI